DLELAEVELVAVQEIAVSRAEELLGVGGVDPGLAPRDRLEVVLAADMARVAVRGQDVFDREALCLLGDLLRRHAGIDDHRLLGPGVRHDVAVDLAVELDLDDGELCQQSLFTAMERTAVVAFALVLLLVCLFSIYSYIRRRSKKRF